MTGSTGTRTAFVTGATGFVGSNIARELLARGWRVIALHRRTSALDKLDGLDVQHVEGDVTDAASLSAALPDAVDAVFHGAASLSMWSGGNAQQTAINVGGTENMVAAALQRGARMFVHTSTISAYGRHDGPVTEATVSNAARSWINYEKSKWQAEQAVRSGIERGLRAVIINPCAVLGPGDTHGWAQLFFMIRDGKLKGIPPGRLTFNDVREVARAHVAAVDRGRPGQNYLLGGETASHEQLIRTMAELLGAELTARVLPALVLKAIARAAATVAAFTGRAPELTPEMAELVRRDVICASDLAEREIDYRPAPLRPCLQASLDWLRQRRLI